MTTVFINFFSIIICSVSGIIFGKKLPLKFKNVVTYGIGISTLYFGIKGIMKDFSALYLILTMVIGGLTGEILNIEDNLLKLIKKIKIKNNPMFEKGFITSSMLFITGGMAVIGSLDIGIRGDNTLILSKSLMDGISSLFLSATYGWGVLFSSFLVFIYEGIIVLLAGILAPFLTTVVIEEMSFIGSLLIVGLSLNILKATDIKLMNYIPCIFLPILFHL